MLPNEGLMRASASRSVYLIERYCRPRSLWWTKPPPRIGRRSCIADDARALAAARSPKRYAGSAEGDHHGHVMDPLGDRCDVRPDPHSRKRRAFALIFIKRATRQGNGVWALGGGCV